MIRDELNKVQVTKQSNLAQSVNARQPLKGARRYGTGHVQLEDVQLLDSNGQPSVAYQFGELIILDITFRAFTDIDQLNISFLVRDITGIDLMGTTTFDEGLTLPAKGKNEAGHLQLSFKNCLRPGSYGISVAITRVTFRDGSDNILLDQIDAVAAFEVLADPKRPIHYKFNNPVEFLLIE
jgi:lipopolysaccharide transport system ATP-binding protein